jgi:RNA polymerase sigma-70 factor (ECF subfamily)
MSLVESECVSARLGGTASPAVGTLAAPAAVGGGARVAEADRGSQRSSDAARAGQLPLAWFREHFGSMWRLALRLGVPQHSVDDVVQEAFIISSRRHADIGEGQERRFLMSTVVRVCSNYRQRACVRRELSSGELLEQRASSVPDAERLLIEKRARQELDVALATLSDAQRSVFVLYELEGFSMREIAEMLGLSSHTVASRLGRARTQFSRAVQRLQSTHAASPEVP